MSIELEIKDKARLVEGIKITPFRQNVRKTSPHKHNNYFEIIYLTKGKGTHTIDIREYEIDPPIIFTIRKEQVHFWDIKTQPEGFVLIIKWSFIENTLDKDIKQMISELSAQNCLFPKDSSATDIFKLFLKENEQNSNSKRPIIEGLLKAVLGKLLESVAPNYSELGNSTIFWKFMDILSKENNLTNKVNHYAKLLNTTPQNLNAICRKETGQSASEVLSEHIVSEAKRLLIYTGYKVSEIADKLDFKDNSHFSKYFKRKVGLSPTSFQKQTS